MFSIQDKVVVLTGGTGILGGAFIQAMAEAGARVVILGRNLALPHDHLFNFYRIYGFCCFLHLV
jgi:NAD(P)-dependent dehydrogenase (short-subunit alcohol dehydrogenase family)